MEEIWKSVVGYETTYEVSNYGRVRSIRRLVRGRGVGPHWTAGQIIKPHYRGNYLQVTLSQNGKVWQPYLHRVVATAFHPNPCNLPEVNHKDMNKTNNHADNLEWVTKSQNSKHAYTMTGRRKSGGTPPKKVRVIRDEKQWTFDSIADAASFIGISQSSVSRSCSGVMKSLMFHKYKAEYL